MTLPFKYCSNIATGHLAYPRDRKSELTTRKLASDTWACGHHSRLYVILCDGCAKRNGIVW